MVVAPELYYTSEYDATNPQFSLVGLTAQPKFKQQVIVFALIWRYDIGVATNQHTRREIYYEYLFWRKK